MEIRTLRYFLAVAREGSITRAANFLHLTQPTLSRQMQDLEEELGRPLLIRKSHRVDLTPEGVLLRKRAEEIVSMVDKTEAEFTALEDTVSGDVYIGSGETRALCPIAKVIRQMRADSPGIRYHLYSGNAQDVTERLDKGLLDFGIVIEPADISKYESKRPTCWACPCCAPGRSSPPTPAKTPLWTGSGPTLASWTSRSITTWCSTRPSWWRRGWAMPSPWTAWPTPRRRAPSASARWSRGWSRAWTSSGKSTRSFRRPPSCSSAACVPWWGNKGVFCCMNDQNMLYLY